MIRLAWLTLGCAALTLGCGPAVSLEADTDSDDSSSSAGSTTDSVGSASSTPPNTTTPGTTTGPTPTTDPGTTTVPTATDPTFGSSSGGDSSSSASSGFMESSSGSSGSSSGGGLPDGSKCTDSAECAGVCYVSGIGGLCGECSGDADCDFGCDVPNPLASPPEGSVCNAGNLGENCETEAACVGDLECVSVLDVPGILEVSSCSECNADNDCLPGEVCNNELAFTELSGVWTCTPIGSRPLGSICDAEGSGDLACGSGICAATSVKGLIPLGVCSECDADNPCDGAPACVDPEVGLDDTIVPGTCV